MCDEANIAVKHYFETGDLRSTAVMVPCPYAMELVEWAKTQDSPDVGIHLTLTSEWENYRCGPVSDPGKVPGLIDPDIKMWHDVPGVVTHASAEEVAEEYKIPANAIDLSDPAIAENFRKEGYPITAEVVELLNQYSLPKLDNFSSVPDGDTYENKRDNFFELLKSLGPGLTEIIFHPSVETDNLKTITGSWQQRVWEAQMFSDPVVKNFFTENAIIITTYREVMNRFDKVNN